MKTVIESRIKGQPAFSPSDAHRGDVLSLLKNILASSTEYSIIGKDLDGNILLWNEGARQLYGYGPEEVVGRANSSILHVPEDVQAGRHMEIVQNALRHGKWEGTLQRVRKNGQRFTGRVVITPRRDSKGKPIGFLLISKDISDEEVSERKRFEQAFQEAHRMKSEFLAGMSHELRTPLNAIIGFAEFIADELAGPVNAEQGEYLQDILNSGRHLLQLINDVLDLAKVEAGKLELKPETFQVQKAVEEVCAVARAIAQKKRIVIHTCCAPELAPVTLDPRKFKQVLYNLLSNAVKFTGEGGTVRVEAHPASPGRFRMQVQDTGIGIGKEDLERVFREFEQIESGAARRYEGTGLGLALTKKIVELQGGTISLESAVGKGTVFSVELPIATAEMKA